MTVVLSTATTPSPTRDVPHEERKQPRRHLQAARLVALRDIEARHRAALAASIHRAERGIRIAEALDERFDRRFAAVLNAASMPLTNRSRRRPKATARTTTASATPSTSLDRSERSTHVPAYAT